MFDALLKSKFYTKCKSAIRPTKTRIEMIRKKRDAMQKHLKNDIADLLKSGFDVNAYGRVDGLLVELNISSCYDFLEQYCMHISSQLAIMSKQKECPEDCREAVSCLMFAAARFSDLPELRELRTTFTKRYGNSLECFVNKEFVDKLKSESPKQEMKLQLMRSVAVESGIKWNSKVLEQKLHKRLISEPDKPKSDNDNQEHKLHKKVDESAQRKQHEGSKLNHENARQHTTCKVKTEHHSSYGRKEVPDEVHSLPRGRENVNQKVDNLSRASKRHNNEEHRLHNKIDEQVHRKEHEDVKLNHENARQLTTSKAKRERHSAHGRKEVPDEVHSLPRGRESDNQKIDSLSGASKRHSNEEHKINEPVQRKEHKDAKLNYENARQCTTSKVKREHHSSYGRKEVPDEVHSLPRGRESGNRQIDNLSRASKHHNSEEHKIGEPVQRKEHEDPILINHENARQRTTYKEKREHHSSYGRKEEPDGVHSLPRGRESDKQKRDTLSRASNGYVHDTTPVKVKPNEPEIIIGRVSKEESDDNKAFYYKPFQPSYTKSRACILKDSSDASSTGSTREAQEHTKLTQIGVQMAKDECSSVNDAVKNPKPKSVRRTRLQPVHDCEDNLDRWKGKEREKEFTKEVQEIARDRKHGIKITNSDHDDPRDEEEKMMDKLLMHYTREQITPNKIKKPESVVKPLKLAEADRGEVSRQNYLGGPSGQAALVPVKHKQASPVVLSEGNTRANSYEQDMLSPNGHVHPKLPDYDDFVTRMAALRGKE